jgi:fumarate hydratase class I
VNSDAALAQLEASIMGTVNDLGIGTMGFGGRTTLIGCKVGALNRLPACYFVSVAYDCWAFRRLGVVLDGTSGAITGWLYRDPAHPALPMIDQAGFTRTGREVVLTPPITEAQVRALKVGDVVLLNGRMYTAAIVHRTMKNDALVDLTGGVLPPRPRRPKDGEGWRMMAAGPTTSIREEPTRRCDPEVRSARSSMAAWGRRRSRPSKSWRRSPQRHRRAQFYARCVKNSGVSLAEFGVPEACGISTSPTSRRS